MITLEGIPTRDDAAQLVASVDDVSQIVNGLGESPTARAFFRTERRRGGLVDTIDTIAAPDLCRRVGVCDVSVIAVVAVMTIVPQP